MQGNRFLLLLDLNRKQYYKWFYAFEGQTNGEGVSMIRVDTPLESLPHIAAKELMGDIWFYREECRYLQDAWLEYPKKFQPELLINNEDPGIFFRSHGNFSIPASFYLRPPDDQQEREKDYSPFRHFNAVDSNVCFNQLCFVLFLEGCDRDLIPLSHFGFDTHQVRRRRVTVNILIAKLDTTFIRRIDPVKFSGWIALRKVYKKDTFTKYSLPFMELDFQFEDENGGLAVGDCKLVIFMQNI